MTWREELDALGLPAVEPGVDLGFLDDAEQVIPLVEAAMGGAARRLKATADELSDVLDVLLAPTNS